MLTFYQVNPHRVQTEMEKQCKVNLKTIGMETEGGEYQGGELLVQLSNCQFVKKPRLIGLFDFTVSFLGKQGGNHET